MSEALRAPYCPRRCKTKESAGERHAFGLGQVARLELLGFEELVDEPDRDRALADRGGDTIHRPVADVPRSEDAGHAGLEGERAALFERPAAVALQVPGADE